MKDRLFKLRKELGLSQTEFGERIGLPKPSISRMENGVNDPTTQTIKLICLEFNVDYIWLTEGEGEMFRDDGKTLHDLIDSMMFCASEVERQAFHKLANLGPRYWKAFSDFMDVLKDDKK